MLNSTSCATRVLRNTGRAEFERHAQEIDGGLSKVKEYPVALIWEKSL
jgi:hypothetical protein